MKKLILALLLALLTMALCACGNISVNGQKPITAKWKIISFTVNGKTTDIKNESTAERLVTQDMDPKFESPDGINCSLTIGKKMRLGTMTEDNGRYRIKFNNAKKDLIGEINGDQLTIYDEKGKLSFVFEAD